MGLWRVSEASANQHNVAQLAPAMPNEYIDRVMVHKGVWPEGNTGEGGRPRGSRTKQVDVYLKYIGKFDCPDMRTDEEKEAERIAEKSGRRSGLTTVRRRGSGRSGKLPLPSWPRPLMVTQCRNLPHDQCTIKQRRLYSE